MKKDWVIWSGCFGIFCAGVVWAKLPMVGEFFVINGIHDLAETLGGFASVATLVAAVYGLTAWKEQLRASHNHELARKALLEVSKFRELLFLGCVYADDAITDADYTTEAGLKADWPKGYEDTVQEDLNRFALRRSELDAVLEECAVIWGPDFNQVTTKLYFLNESLSGLLRSYYRYLLADVETPGFKITHASMHSYGSRLRELGLPKFEDSFEFIGSILEPIMEILRARILR